MKHITHIVKYSIVVCALFIVPVLALSSTVSAADLECSVLPDSICGEAKDDVNTAEDSAIWSILKLVINIMTAGVAVLAVGGLVWGAILYTSAGGSQEQIKKALDVIRNVVIGIIAFALMWAFLTWLIPGGVF